MVDLWAVILTALIILSLVTIVMNILVATVVLTTRKLRTVTNIYLASLSCADTIVGSVVMAAMAVYSIYGYWPLGGTACTIWVIFDYCCCTVSMFHLDVIAFQRFKAINNPIEYHIRERKNYRESVKHIIAIWVIGILVWLPVILYFRIKMIYFNKEDFDEMDCLFVPPREYLITQAIIIYYIPIIAMLYYYCRTVYMFMGSRLSKTFAAHSTSEDIEEAIANRSDQGHLQFQGQGHLQAQGHSHLQVQGHGHLQVLQGTTESNRTSNQPLLEKRIRQEKRIAKVLGIVMSCFLVCWLPFCLFWPIVAYCPDCIPLKVYEASLWMAFLNSTINPMLLFTMNKDYRKALRNKVVHSNETNPHVISALT